MRRVSDFPLWISNARDARNLQGLHDAGIVAVVDLAAEEKPATLAREMVYLRYPLMDGAGNPVWMLRLAVRAVARLSGEWVPTLVACGAGMSRSPAVVAVALGEIGVQTADEWIAELKDCGPVDVSPGLWAELHSALARA
jgi:protein-tyrosine phosphatase